MVTMPDCRSVWYGFESRIDRTKLLFNFGMYAGNWFNRPHLECGLCEFESRHPDNNAPVAQSVRAVDCQWQLFIEI